MTFLLDENFPKAATSVLEALGHEVLDFRIEGEPGSSDVEVMAFAIDRQATELTTDRDFFHTISAVFPNHCGIIVIALKRPTRDAILDRLKWLLAEVSSSDLNGRAFQLRDRAWMAFSPLL